MDTLSEKARATALVLTFFRTGRGKPSEIAKAFKTLLNIHGSPKKVTEALSVVRKDWSVTVWSNVADWPPEALHMLNSGKIHRSLVYELACRPVSKDKIVEILREVSTIPSWEEAKMYIQRIFREPRKKLDEIKQEVSREYREEEICIVLVAVPRELKHKLDQHKVEDAVQQWIKEKCPEIPEVEMKELSSYSVRMPRWIHEELKKHGDLATLLGKIIRAYCKLGE